MIKAWIHFNPWTTCLVSMFLFIFIMSYIVMISEYLNLYMNYKGWHQTFMCYEELEEAGRPNPSHSY